MKQHGLNGAIAGAAGTYALDVATYLDVAVRGRASSSVPARTAEHAARAIGITALTGDAPAAEHRRGGVGALMGYGTGLLAGLVYGWRPRTGSTPLWVRGLVLGAVVMVCTDGASVAAGTTDPRTWGVADWLADAVPHAVYGMVTAGVEQLLSD